MVYSKIQNNTKIFFGIQTNKQTNKQTKQNKKEWNELKVHLNVF